MGHPVKELVVEGMESRKILKVNRDKMINGRKYTKAQWKKGKKYLEKKAKNVKPSPKSKKACKEEIMHEMVPSNGRTGLLPSDILRKMNPNAELLVNATKVGYDAGYHPILAYRSAAVFGAGEEDIAVLMGVPLHVLYDWKIQHPEFRRMLQKGLDYFNTHRIEASLRERALGYTKKVETLMPMKVKEDDCEKIVMVKKISDMHIPPDPKAAMFYLQKRSNRWKDKKDRESKQEERAVNSIVNDLGLLEPEELMEIKEKIKRAKEIRAGIVDVTNAQIVEEDDAD